MIVLLILAIWLSCGLITAVGLMLANKALFPYESLEERSSLVAIYFMLGPFGLFIVICICMYIGMQALFKRIMK